MGENSQSRRGSAWAWLPRLVGLACLVYLFSTFDYASIWRLAAGMDAVVWAAAAAAAVAVVGLKFARWHWLLSQSGHRLPPAASLAVYLRGLFWGLVSPARLGEFVKCQALRRHCGQPYSHSAALVVFDRLYDLYSLGGALLVGLALATGRWTLALLLAATLAGGLLLARPLLALLLHKGLALASRWRPGVDGRALERLVATGLPPASWAPVALTLGCLALFVAQGCYLAGQGYGLGFSAWQMLFIVGALNLSGLLPLSIFGLGTNEAVLLVLAAELMPAWYQPEKLIAFSLSLSLLNLLPALVVSGLGTLWGRAVLGPAAGEGASRSG